MSKKILHPAQTLKPEQINGFSSGILVVEAAIATLVLGVFMASNPPRFTAQTPVPHPITAVNSKSSHQLKRTVEKVTRWEYLPSRSL